VGAPRRRLAVFELRNGTWVLAESYQASIADHPPC